MTRKEVLAAIEKSEQEGVFDRHVDPIPRELVIPVTENYHYTNARTPWEHFKYAMEKFFVVWPFTLIETKFVLGLRIEGRENLRGLKAAVLTCNHVAKFDCLCVKHAARGHRTFAVAAPFNNMRGFLGEVMRAGDMLPMSETVKGNYHFNRMVEDVLTRRKNFLLIYPEVAMWWHYPKPRPYQIGGFHMAARYQVPVVPTFITYRPSGRFDKEGIEKYHFTLHIAKPIYPQKNQSRQENALMLRDAAFSACRQFYEEAYGVPLTYPSDARQDEQPV